ncbi:hypothetical protein JY464_07080 [Stenotrophomonas maltophilia]|nr:hypothetical protein [Stenotrophomonas maltophilia]
MTTDKKTLADVKPGGRVRLGDQAERARFEEWYVQNAFDYEANPIGSRDCALMRKAWNAALAAQPSPGGQDALATAMEVFERRRTDIPYEVYEQVKAVCAALAARQPVGEPVAFDYPKFNAVGMGCVLEDRGVHFLIDAAQYGFDEALDQMKATIESIGPLYAAPPAQAVDLSPSQSVLAEVAQERARQEAKWGQQNHVDWTPTLAATDLAGAWPAGVGDHFKFITDYKAKGAEGHRLGYFDILMEEVAEAHDEAREGDAKATRAELVQVAAVAVAWIECIDRRLALTDSQAEVSRG